MKYEAIIFDFNGVLLLDRDWHEEAWNMVSQELRGVPFSAREAEEHIHGRTPKETFLFLAPDANAEKLKELNLLKEQTYQHIAQSADVDFSLAPGAEELFELLQKNHIKFTIATSSPLINLDFYFKYLGLEKWFEWEKAVYDDGALASKPAPDMYLEAAKRLGVGIQRSIVVEDSLSGIQAALNAGAGKVILVSQKRGMAIPTGVTKAISSLSGITLADFEH